MQHHWADNLRTHMNFQYERLSQNGHTTRKHAKILFNVHELTDVYLRQEGLCGLIGVEMLVRVRGKRSLACTASVDRIDNKRIHYTLDNIHFVTWAANNAKNTMTVEQFNDWMNKAVLARMNGVILPRNKLYVPKPVANLSVFLG